ncbi:MAG: class I SAM-dependent RNA methyltransferase, partial [Rhizobiales bacterium]|nr:class I SAM-dependent RNA methyltransferase [Hyphomicrobiales bacterium]
FRRPLFKDELKKYAAAIIDPPRSGAEAQVEQICNSKINQVVYISCNASSFARDAEKLIKSGFKIKHLVAIDQFKYSAHLELVAHLVR